MNPPAAENFKGQKEEFQEEGIELEGEEDILHAEIAKLQDHAAEQDMRIQKQQSLINNLRGELSNQDNKIKFLEVELKNMKHDVSPDLLRCALLSRAHMFFSLSQLPSHGKTDVAAWLSIMNDLFAAHKVHNDARVVAATTMLDQNAQRVVYGNKLQAEADKKPFEWEEFASELKQPLQVQPTQLEVRSRLEKLQCGNRMIQQYAMEFEEIWVLQNPAENMSEGEKIHPFFKGLPEHLQTMYVTDGAGES
ncbi:unnamed protein product [Closterium sp. NIES-65]|nr:unnamed protein product [Closterium sp. NIES-65]